MKLRIRQMPNSKYIVEAKGFATLFRWYGAGVWEAESRHSIERGQPVKFVDFKPPCDGHYSTLWHENRRSAEAMKAEIESILGVEE